MLLTLQIVDISLMNIIHAHENIRLLAFMLSSMALFETYTLLIPTDLYKKVISILKRYLL